MTSTMMLLIGTLSVHLALSATASAQVTTADVVGRVSDKSGAVLPGVSITIQSTDTGAIRTLLSNESGDYSFALLPIGRYSLRVELAGFNTFTVPSITLASGDRARVDAQLAVGQLSESVSVEDQAPVLQTDTSTVGNLITARAVQDLPLNGRNFATLAQGAPGANAGASNALSSGNRPDDRRPGVTIAVGAQGSQVNNYMVDGIDNNDRAIGTAILRPSIEAMAELRVQTSLYTAEVGRVAGGVVNLITKSGTNAYHGTLFEYFRNDILDARNFFTPNKPEYRQNQFGGSIGGPIQTDRTFFFGDYEALRLVQGTPFTANVPTAAMRAGNFSGIAKIYDPATTRPDPAQPGQFIRDEFPNDTIPDKSLNSIAKQYMALYPEPNLPGVSANYVSAFPKSQNYGTLDVRLDRRLSDKDYLYTRYSFNDTTTTIPGDLPPVGDIYPTGSAAFPGPAYQRAQGIHLNDVHTLRPNLLLELKAAWVRFANQTLPWNYGKNVSTGFGITNTNYSPVSSGLTQVSPAGYDSLGDANFLPILQYDNTYQYTGNVAYTRASHNMKFGATLIRRQFTVAQSQSPRGQWTFDGNASNNANGSGGHSLASLLLGVPASANRLDAFVFPGYRTWEPSAFFQDDWRANGRLTLNLGLRWDVFTPFTEVANRISNVDLSTGRIEIPGQNGVSPTANVNTYYGNFAPRIGFAETIRNGFVIRGGFGLTFMPGQYMSQSYLKNPPFISSFSVTNDTISPTYNIVQGFPVPSAIDPNNLSGTIIATAHNLRPTYVQQFSFQLQKEILGSVLGVGYVGALTRRNALFPNINQPDPAPGAIQPRRPYYSKLPGITTLTLTTDEGTLNYHSMQVQFEHRYKNGINVNSNYTWAHALQSGGPGQVQSNWSLEYGNSTLDIRHRLSLTANYELPFGKTFTGIKRQFISGWQTNGIAVFSTGSPFSVTNQTSRTNTGGGDRPDRVADGHLDNPTIQKFFDTTAFVPQALYVPGNSGPFILYGPGQKHVDVSLFKNFAPTEKVRVQFRAESYNITNTPSFSNPNSALGNANFGRITSTLGTPRQLQFALKFLF
jgi:hypothetical protein